jgi:hypothetical protein
MKSSLEAIRRIKEHGIAKGPWTKREEWLNAQIAKAWQDRGAFPGIGSALEALGIRLGTSLCLDLRRGRPSARTTIHGRYWTVYFAGRRSLLVRRTRRIWTLPALFG